jgi:hypothetical protein
MALSVEGDQLGKQLVARLRGRLSIKTEAEKRLATGERVFLADKLLFLRISGFLFFFGLFSSPKRSRLLSGVLVFHIAPEAASFRDGLARDGDLLRSAGVGGDLCTSRGGRPGETVIGNSHSG